MTLLWSSLKDGPTISLTLKLVWRESTEVSTGSFRALLTLAWRLLKRVSMLLQKVIEIDKPCSHHVRHWVDTMVDSWNSTDVPGINENGTLLVQLYSFKIPTIMDNFIYVITTLLLSLILWLCLCWLCCWWLILDLRVLCVNLLLWAVSSTMTRATCWILRDVVSTAQW